MVKTLLFIGAGSFLGGVSRYALTRLVQDHILHVFPYGTLVVNIVGCFLIGLFYGLFDRGHVLDPDIRMFLTVGFCGGFTTFSTFANENFSMLQGGNFLGRGIYAVLSFALGLAMVYLGQLTVKLF